MGLLAASTAAAGSSERLWVEAASERLHRERSVLSEVARKAMPAVVSITTRPPEAALGLAGADAQQGIGSGFIIHPDGYILTSAHVVEGAADVRISLLSPSGLPEELPARVVGMDARTDCALLKVSPSRKLPVLPLGSGSQVDVADWVVVIGNPFGLSHSVSVGVVSFKGRTNVTPAGRESDFDYIQTDASINPGNSGGPVLDLHGRVVAVANAVNVSGQGIGFAIPIDVAKAVIPQLRRHGLVKRGWIGIAVQDLTADLGASLGIDDTQGVVVSDVTEGSPGARAGLRVGDLITTVDTQPIERAHVLRWRVSTRGVGRQVEVAGRRHGKPFRVRVTLEPMDLPEVAEAAETASYSMGGSGGAGLSLFGASLEGSGGKLLGARVEDVLPGSPLSEAGLQAGDVIVRVAGSEVEDASTFANRLEALPSGTTVSLRVQRGGEVVELDFRRP